MEYEINPAVFEDVIKALFDSNQKIIDKFANEYSKPLTDFSESFSKAYKKYLELERLIIKLGPTTRNAYIAGIVYLTLDNIFSSMKLLISGYQTASGNLYRQSMEGIVLAILCSVKGEVKIKTDKNKHKLIDFYASFLNDSKDTQSHKVVSILEFNHQDLGVNLKAITNLKKAISFYHKYSHPTQLSLGTTMTFTGTGESYFGGGFDTAKKDRYTKEIGHRTEFTDLMPNIIEVIISNTKKL